MPTNLIDASAFTSPVVAPADGDSRNAASITQGEQPLADRTRFLLNASVGHLLWNGRLRVAAVAAGIGVYVGAVESLLIGTSLLAQAAETELTGSLPLAGVASWYYVYAYDSGGVLALQASLDAPDAALVWKSTGARTHRYLGCFRTDGAGAPILMRAARGDCRWLTAPGARTALAAGNATAATSIDCAAYAPPHARVLCLALNSIDTGGSSRTVNLYESTTGAAHVVQQVPTLTRVSQCAEMPCSTTQTIVYLVSSVDAYLSLAVDGWRE